MNLATLLACALAASPGPQLTAGKRQLRQRTATVTDSTGVVELHVGAGIASTLRFPLDVDSARVVLVDTKGRFFEPQVIGPTLMLVPKEELRRDERLTLQVGLADGTLVPFLLTSSPTDVDLKLDVELALSKRALPDSVPGLKTTILELQSRLDECQSTAAEQGAAKVGALILKQNLGRPGAFVVEARTVHTLDKQSRLLVEATHVYRLFELSYLVLTVENREPSKAWVMDHAEVAVSGGGSNTDVRVVSVVQELNAIPPAESSRVVVAFSTPAQAAEQRFTLRLLEKGGQRHVELTGMKL